MVDLNRNFASLTLFSRLSRAYNIEILWVLKFDLTEEVFLKATLLTTP
jgi:hypothetical protein